MNIWEHCLLSQYKFGGQPQDYEKVHSFMDSSKYFFYHVKHRLLLHNLFGVELAVELMGNFLENAEGKKALIRDIAVEHCREDLDGKIPTLAEWLQGNEHLDAFFEEMPEIKDETLHQFVYRPYHRSGLKASLMITCSDFGIQLAAFLFGTQKATELRNLLPQKYQIKTLLENFKFTQRWQYSPQKEALDWLKKQEDVRKLSNL